MDNNVRAIKKFNRFYIKEMGIFNLYTSKSSYSATEAMILFEINSIEKCTVSYLSKQFIFDKGYMSRIIKKFEKKGIIKKVKSEEDRRVYFIKITSKGGDDLQFLQARANQKVEETIKGLKEEDVSELIRSMQKIEKLLSKKIVKGEGNEKKFIRITHVDYDVNSHSLHGRN